jgi:hypothetical protein
LCLSGVRMAAWLRQGSAPRPRGFLGLPGLGAKDFRCHLAILTPLDSLVSIDFLTRLTRTQAVANPVAVSQLFTRRALQICERSVPPITLLKNCERAFWPSQGFFS